MKSFLIIDGNSLLNRAFYALPLLTNKRGEFSNAVYGFANMFIGALEKQKPDYVAVAFDYGKKNFRHELYEQYKGTRKKTPEELSSQFALCRKMLNAMGVKYIEKSGIEADDIIGTLAKKANDVQCNLLSGDKDLLQLIDKNVKVFLTRKGISEIEIVDADNINEKFGLSPKQIIDFKALCGETSDNIPGIEGIGEKTALSLLGQFESLDGVYDNLQTQKGKLLEKLSIGKDRAYLSKALATIKQDADLGVDFNIEDYAYEFPFGQKVFNFFDEYDFKTLMKKQALFVSAFEPQEKHYEIQVETKQIKNPSYETLFKKICFEEKQFAFIQRGENVEISFSPNVKYVLCGELTLFDQTDNLNELVLDLKPIFENDKIEKVFYSYKTALKTLEPLGICVKGKIFDISLAQYVVSGGEKNMTFSQDVNTFFESRNILEKALVDKKLNYVYEEIELPLAKVLYQMEQDGFKIDEVMLEKLSMQYKDELSALQKEIIEVCGQEFNINSPKQLGEVLFDKLGLVAYNNKKRSTGIDVLNELVDAHPIIPLIIRYRKIQKLVSTYIEVYEKIVRESGDVIHTIFNQTLTATGRLSSSEPNLQNIPVRDDEGKNLRKLFVSKFEGGSIIGADYNQIELRLLADFSCDETLISAFKRGEDIHRDTAQKIFGKENISQAERRMAKAVNFGVIYGISDYGLSQNIGVSRKSAKEYIERYFHVYGDVKKYMDKNVEFAKENGFIKTCFGRIRNISELRSSNFNLRAFGERVAMNMPLQGSASDIIKLAMVRVADELHKNGLQSQLILQIHDELIIDVFQGEEDAVRKILVDSMENVVKLKVDLPVEVSSGKTWFDCK